MKILPVYEAQVNVWISRPLIRTTLQYLAFGFRLKSFTDKAVKLKIELTKNIRILDSIIPQNEEITTFTQYGASKGEI